jgi:hypothetical protein
VALAYAVSFLSLIVAVIALWMANDISVRVTERSKEMLNDHAVEMKRLHNHHGNEVAKLKSQLNIVDDELQAYRQDFRRQINGYRKELKEISELRNNIEPPQQNTTNRLHEGSGI